MLVTRQNRIPFIWVILAMLPWAFWYFQMQVGGVNFFILNRLIDNPAVLNFVMTLPGLILTFIPLGAYISFKSDRIWTRWGRRKLFIILAFAGWTLSFIAYPLAPNIWVFVTIMFAMSLFGCFAAPLETLKLEIIPPYLRGRSAAIFTWMTTSINIVFYAVVLGRIDEVMPFLGFHLGGEQIVFWSAGGAIFVALMIYVFGIKEIDPKSPLTGEKFRPLTVWNALTMPQLRYLYVFLFATTMLQVSLGPLGTLLYLNQWGYTTQEFGFNVAVGGTLNLFIIPIMGIFADTGKKNRMGIYLACLVMVLLLNVVYFWYVTFYLPDQRPSLVEIIFFGETTCIFSIIAGMVYYPLVYDYIPRNIMGTYIAGASILGGIFGWVMLQGIGLFMSLWATFFQPPAGEMARVCLQKEMSQTQVLQLLTGAHLTTPAGKPAASADISAHPWFGNGIVQDRGTCFEVRLRDLDADAKRTERDALKTEVGLLESRLKEARERKASPASLARREDELASKKAKSESLSTELDRRAEYWQKQVVAGLGNQVVMKKDSEVLAATPAKAVVCVLPTSRKLTDTELDKLNRLFRAADPDHIGLRTVRQQDRTFAVSISAALRDGQDPKVVAGAACQKATEIIEKNTPRVIAPGAKPTGPTVQPGLLMDVALVEDPSRNFVSAISRVVNFAISQFTEVPPPDQKFHSLARGLSKNTQIPHARVDVLSGRNGLRVLAVGNAASLPDPAAPQRGFYKYVPKNLWSLWIRYQRFAWQANLLEAIRTEGASVKLTVMKPVVDKGIVPMRYNYMVGYLYVFFKVAIGFVLVLYFIRMEKKGKVQKLGAMEADMHDAHAKAQRAAARAQTPDAPDDSEVVTTGETYTPGYLLPKLLVALSGLLLTVVSFGQAWPSLHLLTQGRRGEAIVTSVIAQKPGLADLVINSQAELTKKLKDVSDTKDYDWTFYDVFTFEPKEGQEVTFRRDVGKKMGPAMPLLDEFGIPTAAPIRYDPAKPQQAILPLEYSTWFAPTLTGILGLMTFFTGAIMAWFARKPIALQASATVDVATAGAAP